MNLFVTGGSGFIGANFIAYVLGLGRDFRVINFDKLTYAANPANFLPAAGDPRYRFVQGDIADAHAATEAMRGCDAVIHFAAESHVDRSIYEPSAVVDTNITGTFVLLKVARNLEVRRFIHISTDEVYGDMAPGAVANEDAPLRPNNPYSASKASADLLVRSFVRTFGFPAIITRSSNNYGPFQFPEKFLPLMITNALEGQPLPLYGDGQQERNWIHVQDHCRGIMAVLDRGRPGEVYNIGGSEVVQNLEMVCRLLRLLDKPESLIRHVADRPGHDRRYALDSSKIKSDLGWEPSVALDQGLQQTVAWYRNHTQWLTTIRDGAYRAYYKKYYEDRESSLRAITPAVKDYGP